MNVSSTALIWIGLMSLAACKHPASEVNAASRAREQVRATSARSSVGADPTRPAKSDIPSKLRAEAMITPERARWTALARVPGSTIVSEELEREGGRLIYTFETSTPGRDGIDEVNVDALDGTVVDVQHEES